MHFGKHKHSVPCHLPHLDFSPPHSSISQSLKASALLQMTSNALGSILNVHAGFGSCSSFCPPAFFPRPPAIDSFQISLLPLMLVSHKHKSDPFTLLPKASHASHVSSFLFLSAFHETFLMCHS